jgi:hypothetical protein
MNYLIKYSTLLLTETLIFHYNINFRLINHKMFDFFLINLHLFALALETKLLYQMYNII